MIRGHIPAEAATVYRLWDRPRLFTLAPADMVLHSAAHTFHDGEINLAIRDVTDVHDLLVHFGAEDGFWDGLVQRARELDLSRPLFYALRYASMLLDTHVPETVMRALDNLAPSRLALAVMDRLVPRVLVPDHPDHPSRTTGEAAFLLYARSHWLKMPPLLLTGLKVSFGGFSGWHSGGAMFRASRMCRARVR